MSIQIKYLIYMSKQDLALNNKQWLIYHKTKPNQTQPNQTKPNQIKPNQTGDVLVV